MKIYPGMSYWDVYLLPVSIRKWLIDEHIHQMEEQDKDHRQQQNQNNHQRPAFTPLSKSEKQTARSQPMQPIKP